MKYLIKYHKEIKIDVGKIGTSDRSRIKRVVEEKLTVYPEIFGIPLRSNLKGLRKIRVGNYRIIFSIEVNEVYILIIGHRGKVYE